MGIFPKLSDPEICQKIKPTILDKSSWVNIPSAYFESSNMWKSVLPILLLSIIPTLLTSIAIGDDTGSNINSIIQTTSASASTTGLDNFGVASFYSSIIEPLENIIDLSSAFVLVRMARLIGADRDIIIANKIDEACRKYPKNTEFVVVIGMLHCNGVARRILSFGS